MSEDKVRLPPRWFVVTAWYVHRWMIRVTGRCMGLWRPRPGTWAAVRLTTTGRRSGVPRSVILGYIEDEPNLISMAMNGWGAAEPAWWVNLQAHPEAVVELAGGIRRDVPGRAAVGVERERLWQRWREVDDNLDGYAARRPPETALVVLEPRPAARWILPQPEVARSPALGPLTPRPATGSWRRRICRCLPRRCTASVPAS